MTVNVITCAAVHRLIHLKAVCVGVNTAFNRTESAQTVGVNNVEEKVACFARSRSACEAESGVLLGSCVIIYGSSLFAHDAVCWSLHVSVALA